MLRHLLIAATVAALAFPAAAQTTVGDNSSGSNANSGSNSNAQLNNQVGPIDSSVRVGPSTSEANSQSGALSGSVSTSQGGNSTSDAHATGGTSSAVTGASTASNTTTANPTASNAGNAQNITFNNVAPNKTKLETVPQVYAPALSTTLTETCMGSTSGGVSVMGFGGTLGTTWNDTQCVRRLNAREMAQTLGDREAARALLCQDKDVAAAYAAVGQPCNYPAPKEPRQPGLAYAAPAAPDVSATPAAPASPPPVQSRGTMQPIPNPPKADGERG